MTIPASNSHTGVARYVQLATLFQRRIETDQWLEGKQIPTIDQLAAECKVARATVRQALDILERKKLIARYRAKGTFVIKKPQQDVWYEVATDWSGMLMDREGLTIEILSVKNGYISPTIQATTQSSLRLISTCADAIGAMAPPTTWASYTSISAFPK